MRFLYKEDYRKIGGMEMGVDSVYFIIDIAVLVYLFEEFKKNKKMEKNNKVIIFGMVMFSVFTMINLSKILMPQ